MISAKKAYERSVSDNPLKEIGYLIKRAADSGLTSIYVEIKKNSVRKSLLKEGYAVDPHTVPVVSGGNVYQEQLWIVSWGHVGEEDKC